VAVPRLFADGSAVDRRCGHAACAGMEAVGVAVRRVGWADVVDQLRDTFEGDEVEIHQDVVTGHATCWQLNDCSMISRRDDKELVVMCLAGKGLGDISPSIMEAARQAGCKSLRFHTKRPALGRMLKTLGFEPSEYIFRAEL
jgi:hypothetical protein